MWVFRQRVILNSGAERITERITEHITERITEHIAERIGFIWSHVNKTPIRYETESDTLVIQYRVNGAIISGTVPVVKQSIAESVLNGASAHTKNAVFDAVSAPEPVLLCSAECSVSDRFLKRSESSLNTFIRAEIATEPR